MDGVFLECFVCAPAVRYGIIGNERLLNFFVQPASAAIPSSPKASGCKKKFYFFIFIRIVSRFTMGLVGSGSFVNAENEITRFVKHRCIVF
jgi:hypothetical protein